MMTEKITIRLSPGQVRVLEELRDVLNAPISLIVRTIVGSWLTTNDEIIEHLIENKTKNNDLLKLDNDANNQ